MWQVDTTTPYACLGYFVRDREGAEVWAIAVVASFEIASDGAPIECAQAPPLLAPMYRDDGAREMLLDSDLCPFRPGADFILAGQACAPEGAPFVRHDAWVSVAGREKRAAVFAPRRVTARRGRLALEQGEAVSAVPLSWTRALGGADRAAPQNEDHPFNPIGMGWSAQWPNLPDDVALDLPQIEDAHHLIALDAALPRPFGFGALQPGWRPRRDDAGTYDDAWRLRRAPLPPADFREMFHHVAPRDQIFESDALRGAPISVGGLHPDGPYQFFMPGLALGATTRIANDHIDTTMRIVSVALEATRKRLRITYNAHVPCTGRDHLVKGSTVRVLRRSVRAA
jgi:hypothetical protein